MGMATIQTSDPTEWLEYRNTGQDQDPIISSTLRPIPCPTQARLDISGRNTFYGPSYSQIDFSIIKKIPLTERTNLDFRAEFFNLFNHPNFDEPNATWGLTAADTVFPLFGQVFNTLGRTLGVGTSRQIQFALRFNF